MSASKLSLTCGVFMFGVNGMIDYNRPIDLADQKYLKKTSSHLGEALENYHDMVTNNTLTYSTILLNRKYCDECRYVYERATRKKEVLKQDGMNNKEAEETVTLAYHGFVQRMTRRALLRNGHYVKWMKAVTQDEIMKVFILPIVAYFVQRVGQ